MRKLPLRSTWISLLGRAPVRAPLAAWSTILNKSSTSTCTFCCAWYVSSGTSPVKKCSLRSALCDFQIQVCALIHAAAWLNMHGACTGGRLGYSGIIQQLALATLDGLSQRMVSAASCTATRQRPCEQAYRDWLPETHCNQNSWHDTASACHPASLLFASQHDPQCCLNYQDGCMMLHKVINVIQNLFLASLHSYFQMCIWTLSTAQQLQL